MLKLENVSKTYLSKSKNKVCVLKHIDLRFSNRGMVFVVGESGSGKSALLNILGGAEKPTHGKVFYRYESFDEYKRSDYDNYRNSVVGFVFEDFNLVEDLNVKENVGLALRQPKEINCDEKILSALKSVGLSEEYSNRSVDELSDGDKQRVAIARAIAKDAKVILADEPTKNLDGETSKDIWNILKTLSKTKLVVVTSCDEESIKCYADRILEISGGQIVKDENKIKSRDDYDEDGHTDSYFKDEKPTKLSNKICLKLGFNNLRSRAWKTVSMVLLSTVTVFLLLFSQMLSTYSTEAMMARFIKNNDIKYFQVVQGKPVKNSDFSVNNIEFKNETLVYVYENSKYIYDGKIDKKQDILDFGLSFVGETVPLQDNAFYITDFALEKAYENGGQILVIDGDKSLPLIKELHTAENIVGKQIMYKSSDEKFLIAGVIDTSCFTTEQRGGLPNAFYLRTFIAAPKDNHFVLLKTDSIKNLKGFLTEFRQKYDGGISDVGYIGYGIGEYAVEFEVEHYYKPIVISVSLVCLVALFLSILSFISHSITRRKNDIGVLSTLGASKKDIAKIFLSQSLLISAITVVLDAVLIVVASHAANEAFKIVNPVAIPYLHPDVSVFIGLLIFAVIPVSLATLLASNKLSKIKPGNVSKGL